MIWLWFWLIICLYLSMATMLFYSLSQEEEGNLYIESIFHRLMLCLFWLPIVLLLLLLVLIVRVNPSDKDLYRPKSK